jgi:hypothetical protein
MKLHFEGGKRVPDLIGARQGCPAKEEGAVHSLGGELAIGRPLPGEDIIAGARRHVLELMPKFEELDHRVHR